MRNIILFYQHIGRELHSINKLKSLVEDNNSCIYIFSIDFEYIDALHFAKKNKIDLIVTPWMYHKDNYKLFVRFIEFNDKLKIINLHQEQITSPFSERILLPQKGAPMDSVYHFVWGEYFKQKLINIGVNNKLIFVTGNMRNDEIHLVSADKRYFADIFGLSTNKKWILFSDNRNWVYKWQPKMKKERLEMGVNENELDEFLKINIKSLEISIEDMNKLDKSFFDNYEFIYRPHPGCNFETNLQKKIKVIQDFSIYEWLRVVDVNVVWSSTTIFESDAMGVPSIVYEPILNPLKFKTEGVDEYYKISIISEIDEASILASKMKQDLNKTYKTYYGEIDGKATDRVAGAIKFILNNNDDEYSAEIIKVDMMMYIIQYLHAYITKIFVKTRLIEKMKFPRSAYLQLNDIPYYKKKK